MSSSLARASASFKLASATAAPKRSDGVEWSQPQAPVTMKKLSDMLGAEYCNLAPHQRKRKLEEVAGEKGHWIAFTLSQWNRRVNHPDKLSKLPNWA